MPYFQFLPEIRHFSNNQLIRSASGKTGCPSVVEQAIKNCFMHFVLPMAAVLRLEDENDPIWRGMQQHLMCGLISNLLAPCEMVLLFWAVTVIIMNVQHAGQGEPLRCLCRLWPWCEHVVWVRQWLTLQGVGHCLFVCSKINDNTKTPPDNLTENASD